MSMDYDGEYKCIAENSAGTTETVAKVVVEGKMEGPEFTRPLADRECREGRPVKFECATKGIPKPDVKWFINDQPIEPGLKFHTEQRKGFGGDITHSLSIDNTEVDYAGKVKAVATNKAGEIETTATLTVEEKKETPKFVRKLENIDTIEKQTITFEVEVTGKPKPHVTWSKGNVELQNMENIVLEATDRVHTMTLKNVKPADAALYSVKAHNPAGQTSCSARLKVAPARRPSFMRRMSDILAPENGEAKFDCKVEGFPLPEVKWFINDKELEPSENVIMEQKKDGTCVLTIKDASPDMQGEVRAVAANVGGEDLCNANLEVRGQAPTFIETPIKCTILEGDVAIFKCLIKGEPSPTVEWSKGKWSKLKNSDKINMYKDENTSEDILEIKDIKKKDAGTYNISATNEHGTEQVAATLIVTSNPEEAEDWKASLKHREYDREHAEIEADWLPNLKHVEGEEGSPVKEEEKELVKEKDEPVAFQILQKRRMSELEGKRDKIDVEPIQREKIDLDMAAPTKLEKEEAPTDELEKKPYKHEPKEVTIDEVDATELFIPKVKWEWTTPLKDVKVKETESADFQCEFSVADVNVTWTVKGEPVEASPKYSMTSEGKEHKLTVAKCRPKDVGEVTCSYSDYKTSANLDVEEMVKEFTVKLDDTSAVENAEATFTCETNDDEAEVVWMLDNKPLPDSDKYKTQSEGTTHTLTIYDLTSNDNCDVSATFGDQSTSAKLAVEEITAKYTVPLSDVSVLEKSDAEFSFELSLPVDKVRWFLDDVELRPNNKTQFIDDGKLHKLILKDVDVTDEGQVSVLVGDKKSTANLFVQELSPDFMKPLSNVTVKEHENVEFVTEVNKEGVTVKWFVDNKEIEEDERFEIYSEGRTHRLIIKNAVMPDSGEIMARVEGKTQKATLEVQEIPVEIVAELTEQHVEEHKASFFTCEVNKPDVTVTWLRNGEKIKESEKHQKIEDGTTHTLVIMDTDKSDVGEYTVVIGDRRSSAQLHLDESPINVSLTLKRHHIESLHQTEQLATFTCLTSKSAVEVKWYKDKDVVKPSSKYELQNFGREHRLTVHDLCMSDYGDYAVSIRSLRKFPQTHVSIEPPTQFIIPLSEATCQEGDDVTFTCEITDDKIPARWFKDEEKLQPSDKYVMKKDGRKHSLTIKNATLEDRAEYTINLKDGKSSAPLFVEETPLEFTMPLQEQTECIEGDTVTLVCEVNKPNKPAMWLRDGEQIVPGDGVEITVDGNIHKLLIRRASLDSEAEYTCMIGNVDTTTMLYVEEPAAEFTHRLSDVSGQEGEDIEMYVELSRPDVPVNWMKNRMPLKPSERIHILCERYRQVLQILDAIPEDEGEYTVCLPDKTESSAIVKIKEKAPEFSMPLDDQTVKEKDILTLTCELTKPDVPVKWLKNGKEIKPDDRVKFSVDQYQHQLVVADVTLSDADKYTCVCGDVSTECTIKVEEQPVEFTKPLEDQTVKEKETLTLTCELNKPDKKVKWLKNGKEIKPDKRIKFSVDQYQRQLIMTDVTLTDSDKYTCVCGDVSTECTIKVEELPVEFTQPLADLQFKEKKKMTLTCELNKPNKQVKWLKDGEEIKPDKRIKMSVDKKQHQMVIADVTVEDEGKYTCVCDDVNTESSITVEELPVEFTKPLKDKKVKEKETLTLTCELNKPNKPVKWLKNGEEIVPDDRVNFSVDQYLHQLVIADVTVTDADKYTCVCGDVSTKCTIKVDELPVEFTKPLTDQTIKEKETLTLTCEVNKPNAPVKWLKNGKEIKPNDRVNYSVDMYLHQLVITDVTLEDASKYRCVCKDVSTTCTVKVEELPTEFTKQLEDTKTHVKETVTLTCELNKPKKSVKWMKDGKPLRQTRNIKCSVDAYTHQLVFTDITLQETGTYSCTCGDVSTSCTVTVAEEPVKITKPLTDTEVDEKEEVTLTCEVNKLGKKPVWFLDEEEIKPNDRVKVTSRGLVHKLTIQTSKLHDEGKYTVAFDDVKSTANLTVKPLPVEFIAPLQDLEITKKSSVALECEVNKPDAEATWTKDNQTISISDGYDIRHDQTRHSLHINEAKPEDSAEYTVTVDNKSSTAKLNVKDEEAVEFTAPLEDKKIQEGEDVTLECTVSQPDLTAEWKKDGSPVEASERIKPKSVDTTHTLHIENVSAEDSGEYEVQVGDTTSKSSIEVEETPLAFIRKLSDIDVGELPGTATFECELNKDNVAVKWYRDNKSLVPNKKYKMIDEGPVHKLQVNDIDGEDEGKYWVIADGLKSEASLFVEVPPELFLDKKFEETVTLKRGQSTAFEIPFKGSPQPAVTWLYNGGDLPDTKRMEVQTIRNMTTCRLGKVIRTDAGEYTLTLENTVGKTSLTITLNVLDKPSAPQDVSADNVTAESCDLHWQPPKDNGGSDIKQYVVEKREANRRSWNKVSTSATLEMTIPKLTKNIQYVFRVAAENDVGIGEFAELPEPVTAKDTFTVPDAPEAPKVSEVLKKSALVAWQPPTNDGGSPVIGYHLERKTDVGSRWIKVTKKLVPELSMPVNDLEESLTYQFRVIAENKAGPSKPSEPSQPITAKDPWDKPSRPGVPEIMGTDKSSVALKWSPPSTDGGDSVDYIIEYRRQGSSTWKRANSVPVQETNFSVPGLKEGDEYEFRITAQNKAGLGPSSEISQAVRVETPLVGVPPKILEPLSDVVVIAPKDAILECDLELGEPESDIKWFKGNKEVKKSPKYEMSYEDDIAALVIHKTEPDDTGTYSLQATNPLGKVKSEGSLAVHTHPKLDYDNRLKGIQNIKAGTTLSLPVNTSGIPNPTIAWFLDEEPIEKSSRVTIETTDDKTTLTIKNSTIDDTGVYTVEAENTVGKAVADFDVNVKDKPSKPQNLSVSEVMKDSIVLSWQPPTNNGGSDITAYIIEKRDAKRNTYTQVEKVTGLTNTYAVQKLLEGNEYYFRVSAENDIGKGEPAEMEAPIMAKCPFDVPDSPKHLQATEVTKSSVTLTWEVPQKDGGSPITGYVLERCQLPGSRWVKASKKPISDTMFTVPDLYENTEYQFRVSAVNAIGVGKPCEPTSPIKAKDPYDKPSAPGVPNVTEVTNTTANLDWTPPTKDGGSPVYNYLIEYKPVSGKKWLPANKGQTTPETSFTVTDLPEGEVCEFRVTAENKAGLGKPSDVSEKVTVKAPVVGEAPSVLEGLPDVSVLLGENAYIECKISGEPEPTIAWFRDSKEIRENKKYQFDYTDLVASIKINEVTEKDATSITCEASNDLGSVKTTGQLEVQDKPKLDYDNKFRDIVTLNSGSTLKIPVKVSGLPKPSVTWSKDEKPVRSHGRLTLDISDKATTLTLKKVTREDDGLYSILAENEAGQATAKFDIEVIDVPEKPENLKIDEVTRDSVKLSWQPPKDDGGTDILSYIIERRDQGRSMWMKVTTVDAAELSYCVKDLVEGKEYFFRVSAKNEVGISEPIEVDKAVTPKSGFGMFHRVIPLYER